MKTYIYLTFLFIFLHESRTVKTTPQQALQTIALNRLALLCQCMNKCEHHKESKKSANRPSSSNCMWREFWRQTGLYKKSSHCFILPNFNVFYQNILLETKAYSTVLQTFLTTKSLKSMAWICVQLSESDDAR